MIDLLIYVCLPSSQVSAVMAESAASPARAAKPGTQ